VKGYLPSVAIAPQQSTARQIKRMIAFSLMDGAEDGSTQNINAKGAS